MSNAHGLTKENLLFTFPVGLRENPSIAALGDVTMEALAKRPAEIGRLSIYPRIDELPEKLLDILAYDFKVDWWDPNYSLEEKRRVFKGNWYVHQHMGTKAAVETAIRAIYPLTTVEEWFEYEGGQPYHFRLRINITSDSGDLARQKRVLERLNFYKNLRSHVDEIKYFLMPEKAWAVAGGGFAGSRRETRVTIIPPPLERPGGGALVSASGMLGGMYRRAEAAPEVPVLEKPGGRRTVHTYGALGGMRRRIETAPEVPALEKPGGRRTANTSGALGGMYRRIEAAPELPELTRPQGTVAAGTGARMCGSYQRTPVSVDAQGAATVPAGRGGAGCSAGLFRTYRRIGVSIPVTTISKGG